MISKNTSLSVKLLLLLIAFALPITVEAIEQNGGKGECGGIDSLSSRSAPPFLLLNAYNCIKVREYEKASSSYLLSKLYAYYDSLRVADISAKGAYHVLRSDVVSALAEHELAEFNKVITTYLDPKSETGKSVCNKIKLLGKPTYHPEYMIRHGLGVYKEPATNNGLKSSFNEDNAWEDAFSPCNKTNG